MIRIYVLPILDIQNIYHVLFWLLDNYIRRYHHVLIIKTHNYPLSNKVQIQYNLKVNFKSKK